MNDSAKTYHDVLLSFVSHYHIVQRLKTCLSKIHYNAYYNTFIYSVTLYFMLSVSA